jgi:hypothetical protein
VGEDRTERNTARYTVTQAADILGISQGAVRNRLSRGTLRSVKEGGTVYVLLSTDMPRDVKRDVADTPTGMSQSDATVLTSELRDRLRYVEEQLEAERQAHAEARRIIAGLVERIPAIEDPSEGRESPQTAEEEPERADPHPAARDAQEGVQRPWWRRMFR